MPSDNRLLYGTFDRGAHGMRLVESPNHGTRADRATLRAAPKMWHSPEQLIAASYEVTTHMMQARVSPVRVRCVARGCASIRGQKWSMHLDMFEQRRFPDPAACGIEPLMRLALLGEARAADEEKKEGQQHRDIHGDGAYRMSPEHFPLFGRECGAPVVVGPRLLESKPEATAQYIIALSIVRDSADFRLPSVRR